MNKTFTPLIEKAEPKDGFKHQTHERIAKTLSKLLIKNKGKGQTIGLEGVWGSGKSTVISILKDKLPEKDFTYFYFDAWAHEGDPLRRVFLESLIKSININDPKLEKLEKKISNRERNISTKTRRQATIFGKIMSLSLFLVPFGAAIISTLDFSNITFQSGKLCWELILGTIFTLAPFIIILLNLTKLFRKKDEDNNTENRWSFLEDESNTDIIQEISEDEEKSSIEFERYFDEIIEIAFNGKVNKQLVVVIDNLDRIDAKDSLKIWSTLQTFLQQRNPDKTSKISNKNIWIIVPYDAVGLATLWDSASEKAEDDTEDSSEKKQDGKCADSFFDKCFQIRLEVPKPILSDWEDFTVQMIESAFGDKFEFKNDILDVIRITRDNISDTLTPREIKTYINQVGINWLNCEDDIPIASVAYYVIMRYLNKMKVVEVQESLVEGKILNPQHKNFLPSTIIKDLAGLSFGVSSKIGQQLLLEPELAEGLKSYEEGKLESLLDVHENGFWFVFNYHIERVSTEDVFSYSNTVYKGLWNKHKSKCKSYTQALKNRAIKFSSFDDLDNHIGFIEIFIASKTPFKHYWGSIISYLRDLLSGQVENIDNIFNVLAEATKRIPKSELSRVIIKTEHLENWKSWSIKNKELSLNLYEWIVPEEAHYDGLSTLVKPSVAIPEGTNETVEYFFESKPTEWDSMVEACKQHIYWNNGTGNAKQHSIRAIEILFKLCFDNDLHKSQIEAILKDGRFYNYIHHQNANGLNINLVALLIAKCFPDEVQSFTVNVVGNSNSGLQIVRNFWATRSEDNIEACEVYLGDDIDLLWKIAIDPKNKLIGAYISYCVSEEKVELFQVENALVKYRNSIKLNEDVEEFDEVKLGQYFVTHSQLEPEIKDISKDDIIEFSDELYNLIDLLNEISGISNGLKTLSESEWTVNALENDTYLTSLALAISKKDKTFELENSYYDALLNFAKSKIPDISTLSDWQKKNWSGLVSLLSPDFLSQFKNNLTVAYSQNLNLQNIESIRFNADYIDFDIICKENRIAIQTAIEASVKSEAKLAELQNILFILRSGAIQFEKSFKPVVREPLNSSWNTTTNADYKNALEEIAKKIGMRLSKTSNPEEEK